MKTGWQKIRDRQMEFSLETAFTRHKTAVHDGMFDAECLACNDFMVKILERQEVAA